jgi:hypothetical protein
MSITTEKSMSIRYSETIPLNTPTVAALKTDSADATELLRQDIESCAGKVVSILRSYQRLKDNGGKIYTFTISSDIAIDTAGSGFFEVTFPVRLSYGCRELIEWINEKMVFSVQLDYSRASATITGEVFVDNAKEPDSEKPRGT